MKKNPTPRRIRIGLAAIVFILIVCAFLGICHPLCSLLKIQFAPALIHTISAFSQGALATILVIAIITLLFGRFYCSLVCPLGIAQDFLAFVLGRKSKPLPKHLAFPRLLLLGAVLGLLASGWTLGFKLLDPYSNYGRMAVTYGLGAILPLIIILALLVWRRRLFCNAICPVGTMLGLIARFGVFKLHITEKCVKCGRCARACNAGCIDLENRRIDNARCVRCLNCISACLAGAIRFGRPTAPLPPEPDLQKRELLLALPAGVVSLGAGAVIGKHFLKKLLEERQATAEEGEELETATASVILPPGAGDVTRFAATCTSCLLCVNNCPSKIIRPSRTGYGYVTLDLSAGKCVFDCNRCSQICPTGAIRPLPLADKQRMRIAQAAINYKVCKVFQEEEECGKCAGICPTHAITLRKTGAPKFNKNLCIGCGACKTVCPNQAITVTPISTQEGLEQE